MLDLLLLRHAKSAWDDPTLDDHARPLTKRGRRAADLMGDYLRQEGLLPDLALVSGAARTRETWKRLARRWNGQPAAEVLESLYLAEPARLLAAIRQAPAGATRLLLLGHNPGLERLARRLAGSGSEAPALAALKAKFPTAALAWLQFDAPDWQAIGEGRLLRFVTPRDLAPDAGDD